MRDLFVIFLILCSCAIVNAAEDNGSLRARFQAEAPSGWERLRTSSQSMSGSQTYTFWIDIADPKEEGFGKDYFAKQTRHFVVADGAGKICIDSYDRSGKWLGRNVQAFNPKYAFTARQVVSEGPYSLTQYGRTNDIMNRAGLEVSRASAWAAISYRGWWHLPLPELIKQSYCKVLTCEPVSRGGNEFVEVVLSYGPTTLAATQDPSPRLTTLILDPRASWRVVSDITMTGKETDSVEVHYVEGGNAAQVAKVEHTVTYVNKTKTGHEVMEFDSLSYHPLSAESAEFDVSSLGFPKLESIEKSARSDRVRYLLWTAVIIVAVLILYLRRKTRDVTSHA